MKPRLLDLFCGAGGAAMGYHRAGFEVVGVDINPQPNYPFKFVQDDALRCLREYSWRPFFSAIHASPPCQAFTVYGNNRAHVRNDHPDLIAPTREMLDESGLPYVIENVPQSPLIDPIRLCGSMFDGRGMKDVQRHRLFETNWPLEAPGPCDHSIWPPNRFVGGRSGMRGGQHVKCRKTLEIGRWNIPLAEQQEGMGIDWMTLPELSQAIPPAYTEFIGKQLMEVVRASRPQLSSV